MSRGRVLIVEDSELGGRTLVTVLRAAGYEVRWETTAAAGAATAAAWQPDAIVLDRRLPDADGADLVARLEGHVIVLSGDPAPEHTEQVTTWLVKPVTNRELIAAIEGAG